MIVYIRLDQTNAVYTAEKMLFNNDVILKDDCGSDEDLEVVHSLLVSSLKNATFL